MENTELDKTNANVLIRDLRKSDLNDLLEKDRGFPLLE